MPTHQRQGTKATPWAQIRGQFGGIISPQDMTINKVLFFKIFIIIIIILVGFIFFPFYSPRKQDSHFLELYKIYTARGGGIWPCRRGMESSRHSSPLSPSPAVPARPGAWHEAAPKAGEGGGTWMQLGQILQHQGTQLGGQGRTRTDQ